MEFGSPVKNKIAILYASAGKEKGPVSLMKRYPVLSYVLLAYAITTLGWLPSILNGWSFGQTPIPLALLGGWGPSLAGILMTAIVDGRPGLRALFRRLRQPAKLGWFALVLFGWAGFYTIALIVHAIAGWPLDFSTLTAFEILPISGLSLWALAPLIFLLMLLTGGALNEELGWRGFLLPRLLSRFHPATASLLLAPLWWAWHLPQSALPGANPDHLQWIIQLLCTTIIFTWIFLQTRGNLLLPILLHATQNTTGNLFPASLGPIYFGLQITAAIAILIYWAVRRPVTTAHLTKSA